LLLGKTNEHTHRAIKHYWLKL